MWILWWSVDCRVGHMIDIGTDKIPFKCWIIWKEYWRCIKTFTFNKINTIVELRENLKMAHSALKCLLVLFHLNLLHSAFQLDPTFSYSMNLSRSTLRYTQHKTLSNSLSKKYVFYGIIDLSTEVLLVSQCQMVSKLQAIRFCGHFKSA